VPGTLGGAVVQNAGANEQEIAQILVSVEAIQMGTWKKREFRASELGLLIERVPLKINLRIGAFCPRAYSSFRKIKMKLRSRIQQNLEYRKLKTPYQKAKFGKCLYSHKKNG